MWAQHEIRLPALPRGFHLITREVEEGLPELHEMAVGIAHVFIEHTSASLTLNENASPDVRRDFAAWFGLGQCQRMNRLVHADPRSPSGFAFHSSARRAMEAFGRWGTGWFWCSRRRGFSAPTSYAAYRHAVTQARAIEA